MESERWLAATLEPYRHRDRHAYITCMEPRSNRHRGRQTCGLLSAPTPAPLSTSHSSAGRVACLRSGDLDLAVGNGCATNYLDGAVYQQDLDNTEPDYTYILDCAENELFLGDGDGGFILSPHSRQVEDMRRHTWMHVHIHARTHSYIAYTRCIHIHTYMRTRIRAHTFALVMCSQHNPR